MAENVFKSNCYFSAYNTKSNFDVQLKLKFPESDLANALQFVAGIGGNVKLAFEVNGDKPFALGTFSVYNITIDKDANAKVTFKSTIDKVKQSLVQNIMDEEAIVSVIAKIY